MANRWTRIGNDVYFDGIYVFTFPKDMLASVRDRVERDLGVPVS